MHAVLFHRSLRILQCVGRVLHKYETSKYLNMYPDNQCLCIIMQYSSIIANPKQYEGRVSDMNPVCSSCCLFLLFFFFSLVI